MSIFKKGKKNGLADPNKFVAGALAATGAMIATGIGVIVHEISKFPKDDKFWDWYENNRDK